jgi:WD40 repeat protein
VKVWDLIAKREILALNEPQGVMGIAFSPDGKHLAVAGRDPIVKLVEIASGKTIQGYKGHERDVFDAAFSPDGKTLYTVGRDGALKSWNVETGEEKASWKKHGGGVYSIAVSGDGKMLATGGGSVRLWEPESGEILQRMQWPSGNGPGNVVSSALSPDGKLYASASQDRYLKLWDTKTGKVRTQLAGHGGRTNWVAFSPDGKLVASAGDDATLRLWEVESGREVANQVTHSQPVTAAIFSTDGKSVFTSGAGGSVKQWDVKKLISATAKRAETGEGTVSVPVQPQTSTPPVDYAPVDSFDLVPVPFFPGG